MSLRVDIRKKYKGFVLEMAFKSGDGTLALLGASGSGKSLTLKCIAGLISPDEGVIEADGRILFDSAAKIDLRPQERRVGYLFQNYALFPNMTVRQNISIAADLAYKNSADRNREIDILLARYEIEGLADRYPVELSGGEQQRAALARVFACRPKALLLDEPFSALDTFLRENMQAELRRIIREYDGSVMLVSHSRDEVYKIADELVVLDKGRPVATGSVNEVFTRPGNARAARITGCKNISAIEKMGEHRFYAKNWGIELSTAEPVKDQHLFAGIRAHDFRPVLSGKAVDDIDKVIPITNSNVQNVIPVDMIDVVDGPYEKDIVFHTRDGGDKLWWITKRDIETSGVRALSVAPEAIMLLEA